MRLYEAGNHMHSAMHSAGYIRTATAIHVMAGYYTIARVSLHTAMRLAGLTCPYTCNWIIQCERCLDEILTDAIIKRRAEEIIDNTRTAHMLALTSGTTTITLKPDFFTSPQSRSKP